MELPRASSYSNRSGQLLYAMSQQQQAKEAQQQKFLADRLDAADKARQDEMNQKLKLLELINPAVLSEKLESEVATAGVDALRNNVYAWLKQNQNASPAQLQQAIYSGLGQITEWSNKVKTVKANLEEYFKNMPNNQLVNKSNWMNAALTKALYKPDGQLRGVQELDPSFNYADDTWKNNGEAFINLKEVEDDITKTIKEAPKTKKEVLIGKGLHTKRADIEIPAYARWDENAQKIVLNDDYYKQFTGGEGTAHDLWLTKSAREKLAEKGVTPDDKSYETKLKQTKETILNDRIRKNSPIDQVNANIEKQARVGLTINLGTGDNKNKMYHPIDIAAGIKNNIEGFRGNAVTVDGVSGYDVSTAYAGFQMEGAFGKKELRRVIYNEAEDKIYYSTSDGGKLKSTTRDGFTRMLVTNTPDIGVSADRKNYRELPKGKAPAPAKTWAQRQLERKK
jgi:hypothetical protein